ncbi:hypothetical protein BO70DRAFT_393880 [Aspergillus heteromorphus CBS 117.55]|uniref:Uncharacterized protein n=1 Tax=Aspergillus heteromorphus CBS 117.55 TaxID=1448321 RepID=A0A317WSM7_9EURO|nr:uncharacterized protein BO70DRAFT_393880 [Aspergillus heteromorphus CBS 117.55]PWY88157.1 hypothetical protein BO70DRAFT_393880 [Aspergillus heteromorphus CBS 117.55]
MSPQLHVTTHEICYQETAHLGITPVSHDRLRAFYRGALAKIQETHTRLPHAMEVVLRFEENSHNARDTIEFVIRNTERTTMQDQLSGFVHMVHGLCAHPNGRGRGVDIEVNFFL